ncbi:MAG: hypothetical protein CSA68_09130 [Rhodobacterales bacterium]|nr:MAG: hypothetical protein CSA68_09130 [Rhodobacterales bacterium]
MGARAGGCDVTDQTFLQITVSKLDAGIYHNETFHLASDGQLGRVLWRSDHRLMAMGGMRVDPAVFPRLRGQIPYPARLKPTGGGGRAPRGVLIEMIQSDPTGAPRISRLSQMPADIAAVLAGWRQNVAMHPPKSGRYLWVKPAITAGQPDIRISPDSCDQPLNKALMAAVAAGDFIVPAPAAVKPFVTGGNKYREQFRILNADQSYLFGVLSAP